MRVISLVLLSSCTWVELANAQANLDAGELEFRVCAGCHGFVGEGNVLVSAPRLAGLETWYLDRQMRNFASGLRGHVEGDATGQRMAVMAQAVGNDRELEDLIAYIATLPASSPDATVAGDADSGRTLYAPCSACHGMDGEGNEALASPALAALDDWYVVEQLRHYADGLRGTHPQDTYGQQMRAFSASFADDESRRDLAAYIRTLSD